MFNIEDVIQDLRKEIDENNILINEPMKKHTTFKIGGNADIFIKANTIENIQYILKISKDNNIPLFILGNGSNILVNDDGIRGIVLKINLDDIDILEDKDKIKVTAGAGVKLTQLARYLLKNSIEGFEFASGIPGTIGGAIRMNAGAYGKEMKDIVNETKYLSYDGEIITISNNEHNFEYRNSKFSKEKSIILKTTFILDKGNADEIKNKIDEYSKQRKEKQPIEFPNAGSTFKRGNDFITAKLIDECGLKGYRIGGAEVSKKHAGFIINVDNATSNDVIDLINYVKEKVYEKFKKEIQLEIEIIGG